jgi:hypothetical protein
VDVDGFFEHPNSPKGRKLFGKFVPQNSTAVQTETKKKDGIGEQQIAAKKQILMKSEADEEKIADASLDSTSNIKNAEKSMQGIEEKETKFTKMSEKEKAEKISFCHKVQGEQDETMKLNLEVIGAGSHRTVTVREPSVLPKVSYLSLFLDTMLLNQTILLGNSTTVISSFV